MSSSGDARWTDSLWRLGVALALASALHALLLMLGTHTPVTKAAALPPKLTQNVTLEPAPPPVPTPPPAPPPAPPAHRSLPRSAPPPAAAAAAKVVTVAPDPAAPLDFTDFELAQGKADAYAGGTTAATGTSTRAVSETRVSPTATAAGETNSGSSAAPARKDWACAWPEEEDQTGNVRELRVTIQVRVDRDGAPQAVEVLGHPPPSFASAARHCALSETYQGAKDSQGHRVSGATPPFVVHFVR